MVGGRLELHDAIQAKRYLDVRLQGDRIALIAGHYLGLIPLNARYAVHVVPKVPVANLVTILGIARQEPLIIESLLRHYQADTRLNIFDLLAEAIRDELPLLEAGGLARAYVPRTAIAQTVRGRPLFKETMSLNWSRGRSDRVTHEFYDFTRDALINRAIKYTLWHLVRAYPYLAANPDRSVLVDFHAASAAFSRVMLDRGRSFLPALRRLLREDRLGRSVEHLRRLLHLCWMVLDDLGVDLDVAKDERTAIPPLVVNMEDVFQSLVLRLLQQRVSPLGLQCWDTAREHQLPLYSAPISLAGVPPALVSDERAKPDFVLADAMGPLVVGDVKYSVERKREHVYQVVAHALAYGATHALLVYPEPESRDPAGVAAVGAIGTVNLFTYRFRLAADDIPSLADNMVSGIVPIIASALAVRASAASSMAS